MRLYLKNTIKKLWSSYITEKNSMNRSKYLHNVMTSVQIGCYIVGYDIKTRCDVSATSYHEIHKDQFMFLWFSLCSMK